MNELVARSMALFASKIAEVNEYGWDDKFKNEYIRESLDCLCADIRGAVSVTGLSKNELALIQQITLLLRISAAPNTVDEYASNKTPVKIQKVCDMLESWNDEPIVIGVRHKIVVDAYADEIKHRFPDRKLFVVTGSTTTLAGRRKLKGELKSSGIFPWQEMNIIIALMLNTEMQTVLGAFILLLIVTTV